MIKNNYGVWLDSEVPSPGVISANKLAWEYLDDEICLDCEEAEKEIMECETCPECGGDLLKIAPDYIECEECLTEYDMDGLLESIECFEHTKLIGDWLKDEDGKYYPDETKEFAAKINNQNDVIVLWSKFTTRGTPCSPCAPWGVSIGTSGDFLCYTLPEDLLEK